MNNNMNNQYSFGPVSGPPINQQIQPNFNQYQQPMQTPPSKNGNNKKTIIAIVAILAVLAIVAGIILFVNSDKKESVNDKPNNNVVIEEEETDNEEEAITEDDNDSEVSNNLPKEEYDGPKESLTIVTVGHTDHGKSTLTSAITKLYGKYVTEDVISRAPEIHGSVIDYNASIVEYETATRHYYHYDMPGYVDYVKSLISGELKPDGAILVVAATDGPMPQTRDHLKLLNQLGVSKVVVYISKCDMVDDEELLDLVEMEIRNLLDEYDFDGDNTPIVRGSALEAIDGNKKEEKNIGELMDAVDEWIDKRTDSNKTSKHQEFNAVVYVLSKEEGGRHTPFFSDYRPQISIATSQETGIITLPEGVDMVMPGDNIDMTILLNNTVSLKVGDNFKITEGGRVVGVGTITEIIK